MALNEEIINTDIVIPVYKNYDEIKILIDSFKIQENININNIICPLTLSNTKEDSNIIGYLKDNGIKYFTVNKNEFSHSLVREKAIKEYCSINVVILLTQDVKLINRNSMYNLAKDVFNGKVAYAYGRQICSIRTLERYIREFNYPKESYIISKNDIEKRQLKAFFASDVFAALNRNVFIKLKGYKGLALSTNEDMLYMHSILTNGYKAKYCADAIVEHYHSLTPIRLYKRYFEAGRFFKKVRIFDQYNKNVSGKELAFYILKESLIHFDIISVIRWPFNMAIRYIGLKRGSR